MKQKSICTITSHSFIPKSDEEEKQKERELREEFKKSLDKLSFIL